MKCLDCGAKFCLVSTFDWQWKPNEFPPCYQCAGELVEQVEAA